MATAHHSADSIRPHPDESLTPAETVGSPPGLGQPVIGDDRATLSAHVARAQLRTSVRCAAAESYLGFRCAVDRFLALAALAVLWPVLVWIAIAIRRDSPGPAVFRQTRAGLYGRPFTLLKFRTMRTDADPFGDSPQTGADPRITPLGRWLRETSLDELPQLLNVLRDEMALIGPRPLYLQQARDWDDRQRGRLLVRPGLTGLAQVQGRGSLTIEDKLELDVRYVEKMSVGLDVQILARTLGGVWRAGDIYEKSYSRSGIRFSELVRAAESPVDPPATPSRPDIP